MQQGNERIQPLVKQVVRREGFTLIELLIVIAIIAILAAILFPVFAKARDKARQAACMSNMKQIALATAQYVQDFDSTMPLQEGSSIWKYQSTTLTSGSPGNMPLAMNLFQQIYPYSKSYSILACPSAVGFVDPASNNCSTNANCLAPNIIGGVPNNTNYVTNGVVMHCYDGNSIYQRPVVESKIPNPSEIIYLQEFDWGTDYLLQRPRCNVSYSCANDTGGNGYNYWHSSPSYSNVTCPDVQCIGGMHNDGGNVIFCDAHVKWQPFQTLHAGEFGLTPDDYIVASGTGSTGVSTNASASQYYSALF